MSEFSHLDELEAEAIYIIREVAAECEKPVMLPARLLIKENIYPRPFQFLRCWISGRPVINGRIFLRTLCTGFSSDKISVIKNGVPDKPPAT